MRIDAVKIGMLAGAEIVAAVADRLAHFGAPNLVGDLKPPVLDLTSGSAAGAGAARHTAVDILDQLGVDVVPLPG